MARAAIIGGGISGLSAAYELARAGVHPVLIELRPRLGGVIQTETVEGCVLEHGPDSFLSAKPWGALELIHELGMGDELIGSNDHLRATYVRRRGRLVPLPDGLMMMAPTRILPVVRTRLVSWPTKVRMGLECFRRPPAAPPPDRSVAEFIRDHYGQEAVDYLAEPLLAGVYGGDPEQLSVASVLGLFAELEAAYGSLSRGILARRRQTAQGQKGPLFQTLRRGLGSLIEALVRAIGPGMTVVRDEALAIERRNGVFAIRLAAGEIEAASVILACQADKAAALVRRMDPELATQLSGIPYSSAVTLSLGFRREAFDSRLPGFGFLVPRRERRRLVACTFVDTKFPHRAPPDIALLRCFVSGEPAESDETLLRLIRDELREILGLRAEPAFARVSRWPRAMAQYTVGHSHRIERIRGRAAAIPGLHLAGNAYAGIGVPDCARTGRRASAAIIDSG